MIRKSIYTILVLLSAVISSYAQQDSLETYIKAAALNNPQVMADFDAYMAQTAVARSSGLPNDPELSMSISPRAMDGINGRRVASFSIMQMFPWIGTLSEARHQMEYKASSAYQKYRERVINLAFQMQKKWFEILTTQEKIKYLRQQQAVLEDLRKVALTKYKSPTVGIKSSKMSDQLLIDAETKKLDVRIENERSALKLQKQQLNLLMHRPPKASVALPEEIPLREMPLFSWPDVERNNPRLAQIVADGKSMEAAERKITAMGLPMFGIGLQYIINDPVKHPQMPQMNGMDMWMPMVKITLPIYRRKTTEARRAARLTKASIDHGYRQQLDALHERYLSITQRAEETKRNMDLYDKETEILTNALKVMMKEYSIGSTSLMDILLTTREQINYRLQKAEAIAKYNTIVAECEQLTSKYDYSERIIYDR